MATARAIPGPRGLAYAGDAVKMITQGLARREELSRRYPDIFRVSLLLRQAVVITNADYSSSILTERMLEFERLDLVFELSKPLLGNGLLRALNRNFRPQRKMIQPVFNHSRVAAYAGVMSDYAEQEQTGWDDGAKLNIMQAMTRLTMRVIGKTMFDRDVLSETDELGAAITEAATASTLPIPLRVPTPANLKIRRAITRMNATLYRWIDERRAEGIDHGDLLSMLIASRNESNEAMSDEQIRDELITIFIAGHETTALALSWCFYLLATHPVEYARAQTEVDRVLGGRTPTLDDLPNLPYTLQVIKETLRLYPTAHAIARITAEDTELDGYHLPKHTVMFLDINAMHHRADYFPNPQRFDPGRFSTVNEKRIPKGAYLPFGTGPRVCIGNQFAMMEAHLLLATIMQRVNIRLLPDQRIERFALATLRPSGPILMQVSRRSITSG